MPPKRDPPVRTTSSFKANYLIAYNALCFWLWTMVTLRLFLLIPLLLPSNDLPAVHAALFSPLLTTTQTLAVLEILHSLLGLVRAPLPTTLLQVASRLVIVWGVIYPFPELVTGTENILGKRRWPWGKHGDIAFCGALSAWGITEMVRYSFFVLQLSGWRGGVPAWLSWARYNIFFVLYPIGISSECWLAYLATGPAGKVSPLYEWGLRALLLIYVPGSYILYTHMMAQRRRIMKGKAKKVT